ncbi:hypothetical protein [Rufibacter sp. XAAS-G3-1]|uniref:hypothetical protein n=1 Tax=Rufibacter sp. XAAS-G3-1 TaxID=2729134 RepID=UPI0015E667E0|nr:hypothetical protein [Rufibacter sp. XAAS-G3-1]
MTQTSREILADVLAGNITMVAAAPALRLAMKREAPLVIAMQEEDGTWSVTHVVGKQFEMSDMFLNPTIKGLSEEEYRARYGEHNGIEFKAVEQVG